MSTSPDDLVNLLSRWLARHVSDEDVRRALDDVEGLSPEQQEAVEELRQALESPNGERERVVRETLEAIALG